MRVIDQIPVGQDRHLAIVQIGIKYFFGIGIASGSGECFVRTAGRGFNTDCHTGKICPVGNLAILKDTLENWENHWGKNEGK